MNKLEGKMKAITFSNAEFIRGFQITGGDYFIILSYTISLLLPADLFARDFNKREVEFEIKDVEEAVMNHPLLTRTRHESFVKVRYYWKTSMIARFVQRVAEDIYKFKVTGTTSYIPGDPIPEHKIGFHPAQAKINKRGDWVPILDSRIECQIIEYNEAGELENLDIVVFEMVSIFDGSASTENKLCKADRDIDHLTLDKLKQEITTRARNIVEGEEWYVAYLAPQWGNETVVVKNNEMLRTAISTMRLKDVDVYQFRVWCLLFFFLFSEVQELTLNRCCLVLARSMMIWQMKFSITNRELRVLKTSTRRGRRGRRSFECTKEGLHCLSLGARRGRQICRRHQRKEAQSERRASCRRCMGASPRRRGMKVPDLVSAVA